MLSEEDARNCIRERIRKGDRNQVLPAVSTSFMIKLRDIPTTEGSMVLCRNIPDFLLEYLRMIDRICSEEVPTISNRGYNSFFKDYRRMPRLRVTKRTTVVAASFSDLLVEQIQFTKFWTSGNTISLNLFFDVMIVTADNYEQIRPNFRSNIRTEGIPQLLFPQILKEEKIEEDHVIDKFVDLSLKETPKLECVICFEKQKNVMCLPCNHVCFCGTCAKKFSNRSNDCPICREKINKYVTIFL